jgi:enoyl-CoA hydratase
VNVATYETLLVEDRDGVRLISINRPKVLNALNAQVVDELSQLLEATADDANVRAVVLTGAGEKAFVAGADIGQMSDMTPAQAMAFAGRGHAVGDMLSGLPMPVIAAVNGFALGGGCELALACDFIYASDRAKFGQPEVKLGVIPGFGGTQRMLRRVGAAMALELCMSGDMIDAQMAIGLVNRVIEHDHLLEETISAAKRIAAHGPLAIAKVKEVIHDGMDRPLDEAGPLEQQAFAELFATEDQKEGMAAFLAKRPPAFKGR